jgi:prepilin signal peptidase PulO-like enzyme (type II secretory pathway)
VVSWIIIFFFGAIWGSFFYTLSVRYADGSFSRDGWRALVTPSKCPACGKRINIAALIPLIGYVLSRGRCSSCGSRIPLLYPLAEMLYGFVSVIVAANLGLSAYSLSVFLIIALSISISIIDLKSMIIPWPMVVTFLILSVYPLILTDALMNNLFGFLLMSVFFLVIMLIFPGSFGGGDLKFSSVIGLLLGLDLAIVALEISLVIGAVTGVIYAVKSGKGLRIKIPFAPFLTAGLFTALLYGKDIILLYYRIIY